jgi:hypothetical protein
VRCSHTFAGREKRGLPGSGDSFDGKRPDLADFKTYELYEIKSISEQKKGEQELQNYLNVLNAWQYPDDNFWTRGRTFLPPVNIVTSTAKIVRVYPARNGVITYKEQIDLRGLYAAALYLSIRSIQAGISQLASSIALASYTGRYGF